MTLQQRLQEAIKVAGGIAALAKRAKMSKASIHNYLSGRTEPKGQVIGRLADAAGVSRGWLFAEVGPMIEQAKEAAPPIAKHAETPRAGYVYLPLREVEAAAGSGSVINGERVIDVLAFKEDWIRQELHAKPADLDLIYVRGKSMEPDLRPGDIILLDHTDTQASSEGVYVCYMNGAVIVKLLQRLPGAIIKVVSKNPDFESYTVILAEEAAKPDGFRVIGRVVWACRRF